MLSICLLEEAAGVEMAHMLLEVVAAQVPCGLALWMSSPVFRTQLLLETGVPGAQQEHPNMTVGLAVRPPLPELLRTAGVVAARVVSRAAPATRERMADPEAAVVRGPDLGAAALQESLKIPITGATAAQAATKVVAEEEDAMGLAQVGRSPQEAEAQG